MSASLVTERVKLTQVEQITILVDRIQVLEGTIQMLSYNLRCLNIRQGSQPVELPNFQAPDDELVFDEEPYSYVRKCTPDDFEAMQRDLVFDEVTFNRMVRPGLIDDLVKFGEDPIAWQK